MILRSYSLLVFTVSIFVLTDVCLVWPENLIQERDRLLNTKSQEETNYNNCMQKAKEIENLLNELRTLKTRVIKKYQYGSLVVAEKLTYDHIMPSTSGPARDVYDKLVTNESSTSAQRLVDTRRLAESIDRTIQQKVGDFDRVKKRCAETKNRITKIGTRLEAINKQLSVTPGEKKGPSQKQPPEPPIPTGECFCLNKWIQGEELEKLRSACKQVRGKDYRRAEINITKPFQYDPKRKECVGSYEKKCQYYDQSAKTEKISRAVAQDQGFSLSWAHQKCK